MLTKRIIPCLDIKNGRTVKGINFEQIRDAGDPVELGALYAKEGADELVFLDITATQERRKTLVTLVKEIAAHLNIPFTVGGGIKSIEDAEVLLDAGADKVSINSSAVRNPQLINEMTNAFGSQFVVVAIDGKMVDNHWEVFVNGGKIPTGQEMFAWSQEVTDRGAGEILFTSMNHDGTKAGFAVEALRKMSTSLSIPVIASGGAGKMEHFVDVFEQGQADAALAASIFHFKEIGIPNLKHYLQNQGIPMRV